MKTRGNVANIRVKHKNIICKKTHNTKNIFYFIFEKFKFNIRKIKKSYTVSLCIEKKTFVCTILKEKSEEKNLYLHYYIASIVAAFR